MLRALDAAWFAVLVLYAIQILHQRPGGYGLLLAFGALGGIAVGGIAHRITRRLGPWRSLLLSGLALAARHAGLGLPANVAIAAVIVLASSAALGPVRHHRWDHAPAPGPRRAAPPGGRARIH